ncbi:hypothetical protein BN1708_016622, partial [Verticillium longisporum]
MNATKRKFNSLIQGIGSRSSTPANDTGTTIDASPSASPRPASLASLHTSPATMAVEEDLLQKRRRLQALTDKRAAATNTIKSLGGTTKVSNIVLKKWNSTREPADAAKPASKYAPNDRAELLKRLATFQEITDWTPKPDLVNEIEWAKRGWVCQGKERVRCTLCSKELLVKLTKKEVDGKDVPALVSSDVEEALQEKYAELVVTAHQEDCLWRRQGCDDSLLRLSLTNAKVSHEALRQRYDELCARKPFLPYEFNLRLPEGLDIDAILSQLPDDFFKNPAPRSDMEHPNRVALALAVMGWQGLSNARIGAVPNSASCHTCLRRLGLWMFKSKEVGPNNEVLVPAPMDHLDPAREHRFFCPWKNPQTQRWNSTKPPSEKDLPAWTILTQVIKNDAYLRGALDDRPKSRARPSTAKHNSDKDDNGLPSTPGRPSMATTTIGDRGGVSFDTPSLAAQDGDEEDEEKVRDKKDKERWARLRRVKSLFETKMRHDYVQPAEQVPSRVEPEEAPKADTASTPPKQPRPRRIPPQLTQPHDIWRAHSIHLELPPDASTIPVDESSGPPESYFSKAPTKPKAPPAPGTLTFEPTPTSTHALASKLLTTQTPTFLHASSHLRNTRANSALPEVAIIGASNCGKSTFLNALAHRAHLARTSARAGHTTTMNTYGLGPPPNPQAQARLRARLGP